MRIWWSCCSPQQHTSIPRVHYFWLRFQKKTRSLPPINTQCPRQTQGTNFTPRFNDNWLGNQNMKMLNYAPTLPGSVLPWHTAQKTLQVCPACSHLGEASKQGRAHRSMRGGKLEVLPNSYHMPWKKNAAFLRGQVPKEMLCVTKVVSSELLVIDGKAKVWLRNWENITSYTSSKPGSATSSLLLMTSFRPQGSAGTTLKCPKQTVGANLRHHHSQEHRLNSVFSLLDQPEGKTR